MSQFTLKLTSLLAALVLLPACASAPSHPIAASGAEAWRAKCGLPKSDRNGMAITDDGPPAPTPPAGTEYCAVASWYGPGFGGRRTASGEPFDPDRLTAAHRTYPFGTRLRVTNPKTGKSCELIVNDRGPFVKGVDIDISRGASRAIGRLDTGPVLIVELGREPGYVREVKVGDISGTGAYRVQVGAFTDTDNASHMKDGLDISYKDVRISQVTVRGTKFNRVQVGAFPDKSEAYAAASRLAAEGYETWVVRGR